ncbi:hypothetical protein [uncultured Corynebacterium sp.]|uniref:hypothetical protein n=1 Tax=uncultured Corynebacterium sp. TaxID=159447 RepID=UPI0025CC503C|nr:hypothetical protein [uncultured Corynebacterium sp.]
MNFRPDNSRSARASHAEQRARLLVQEVLDRDERLRSKLSSPDVDPWEHRFIADDSIAEGPIAHWREEVGRARRLLRRYDIQAGYREKMRDMERRIDAMLHLAEHLEESWDAAAAASKRLSDAEARDAEAFARERDRQTDAAAAKRRRDDKREELRRRAEHLATDALDRTREAGGEVFRKSLDAGRDALEKLPGLTNWPLSRPGRKGRGTDNDAREVRRAEARDLRHQPPLPEDDFKDDAK